MGNCHFEASGRRKKEEGRGKREEAIKPRVKETGFLIKFFVEQR